MTKVLKALIVDDTVVYRSILTRIIKSLDDVEVAGTAANGQEALQCIRKTEFDVVLLDVEMPIMDGLETLQVIQKQFPQLPVMMVSSLTDAERTLKALSLGALDFIPKPPAGEDPARTLRNHIDRCIQIIRVRQAEVRKPAPVGPIAIPSPAQRVPRSHDVRMVVMGVSTGGPRALERLIPALGKNLDCPILIVQHMPAGFTGPLANSLARRLGQRISEAKDGDEIEPGSILVAPGGRHMALAPRRKGRAAHVQIDDGPPVKECRPSVDVLFNSVAQNFDGSVLSVILTGMGSDGCEGVKALRESGASCIAQDEASCVVYGMPRTVVEAGLTDEVLPLELIASRIIEFSSDVPPRIL